MACVVNSGIYGNERRTFAVTVYRIRTRHVFANYSPILPEFSVDRRTLFWISFPVL